MPKQSSNGKTKHIMVINDITDMLDLFQELLEEEGYRVNTGSIIPSKLIDTLGEIKRILPDLVIVDFMFGSEPLGWQLVQMLQMDRQTARIPCLICTAAVDQVRQLETHLGQLQIGVVIKPFEIDTLLEEITRTFQRAAGEPSLGTFDLASTEKVIDKKR